MTASPAVLFDQCTALVPSSSLEDHSNLFSLHASCLEVSKCHQPKTDSPAVVAELEWGRRFRSVGDLDVDVLVEVVVCLVFRAAHVTVTPSTAGSPDLERLDLPFHKRTFRVNTGIQVNVPIGRYWRQAAAAKAHGKPERNSDSRAGATRLLAKTSTQFALCTMFK